MDFASFLLVNTILFLRPAEIVPELERLPLYYLAILLCLACSMLHLMRLFLESPLIRHPTTLCVFGMFLFAAISLPINSDKAFDEVLEYAKIMVYFCLFLAIVRTPARLQGVIACVVVCMTITAAAAILHYHEFVQIASLQEQFENLDRPGSTEVIKRLRFTGILHDANEVGVFTSILCFLCGYQLTNRRMGMARFLWAVPIGIFLYSLYLTQSRGGLLSFIVGLTVFSLYAFRPKSLAAGTRKQSALGIAFLAVVLPIVLIAFGGRQTNISTNAHTAQTRFGLWSDWLQEFRSHPLFGVGPRVMSTSIDPEKQIYVADRKMLAHNSYLQAFADLGFFGGLCFLGAAGFAFVTLHRFAYGKTYIIDPDLSRLQPYLMAALAVCALGFLTLSLDYVLPTYFVLALPVAYYGMTKCLPAVPRPALTFDAMTRLGAAGVGFLAFTYAMVLVMPKQ